MNYRIPLCAIILFVSFVCAKDDTPAPKVHWEKYSEALAASKKDHKLIFVDLYADWCVPCKIMEANAFMDNAVSKILNTRFHPVRLNVDSQAYVACDGRDKTVERCVTDVWKLNGVPSFVLISPKGLSILTLTRMLEPDELRLFLFECLQKEKDWITE